jgi:hypothetical protein
MHRTVFRNSTRSALAATKVSVGHNVAGGREAYSSLLQTAARRNYATAKPGQSSLRLLVPVSALTACLLPRHSTSLFSLPALELLVIRHSRCRGLVHSRVPHLGHLHWRQCRGDWPCLECVPTSFSVYIEYSQSLQASVTVSPVSGVSGMSKVWRSHLCLPTSS